MSLAYFFSCLKAGEHMRFSPVSENWTTDEEAFLTAACSFLSFSLATLSTLECPLAK
jgi:hypothetical protein